MIPDSTRLNYGSQMHQHRFNIYSDAPARPDSGETDHTHTAEEAAHRRHVSYGADTKTVHVIKARYRDKYYFIIINKSVTHEVKHRVAV